MMLHEGTWLTPPQVARDRSAPRCRSVLLVPSPTATLLGPQPISLSAAWNTFEAKCLSGHGTRRTDQMLSNRDATLLSGAEPAAARPSCVRRLGRPASWVAVTVLGEPYHLCAGTSTPPSDPRGGRISRFGSAHRELDFPRGQVSGAVATRWRARRASSARIRPRCSLRSHPSAEPLRLRLAATALWWQ